MIVRNKHQTAELIRKGRRVDYVYRGGERVFGYEPIARLEIGNWKLYQEFSAEILKEIREIRFSNIVSTTDLIDNKILEISYNSPFKVYVGIKNINNTLFIYIMSRYYGANTIFSLNQDCSNFFRLLNIENNVFSKFSLENITSAASMFAESNISIPLNWINCENFYNCFYYYNNTIDCSTFTIHGKNCYSFFWGSGDKIINLDKFDTSAITNMRLFFYAGTRLILNDIKNWNVEEVTNIENIFARAGASSVLEVDLSGWKLISCINANNVFDYYDNHNNTCRIIKTPAISALVDIDLGRMFYYEDGSEYGTFIPANTVGSVTIYRTPPT